MNNCYDLAAFIEVIYIGHNISDEYLSWLEWKKFNECITGFNDGYFLE